MKKELTGNNGAQITLNYADTEIVEELIQLIAVKCKEINIIPLVDALSDAESFLQQDMRVLIPLLKDVICELESDKKFTDIVYNMLRNCTYNNVVISRQLFNDKPEAREDYYMIKKEVVKFNLTPFLKSLNGKLLQSV